MWRNLMVVWALTGLWHGAAWTFVAWGLYYGVLIGLERTVYGKWLAKLPAVAQHAYGLLLAGFGWVLFRSESFGQATDILTALWPIGSRPLSDPWSSFAFHQNWVLLIVASALAAGIARPVMYRIENELLELRVDWSWRQSIFWAVIVVVLLVVSTAFMVAVSYKPFIYFRF
jgi:alginate O-acetyltransferase complex protein AlgI